jgi:NitT/TauT family transport system permease protein
MRPLAQSETATAIAAPLMVGLAIVVIWEIACRSAHVPVYLFPKPSDIVATLIGDWSTLFTALCMTLRVALQAFAAAIVIGTLIAFLFVQSRAIEKSFFPYAVLLQVTPVVAIAPLIIILVKNTQLALTICATVVALFPIISNTTLGLRSVDPGLANLFRMNRAGRLQTLFRLRIPSALPYFFGGLRISSGLALIGAVVAEFVAGTGGRSAGLAYEILQSGFQLDIPRMFAALFLITLAGVGLFTLMTVLSKLALGHWHESEMGAET